MTMYWSSSYVKQGSVDSVHWLYNMHISVNPWHYLFNSQVDAITAVDHRWGPLSNKLNIHSFIYLFIHIVVYKKKPHTLHNPDMLRDRQRDRRKILLQESAPKTKQKQLQQCSSLRN